MPTYEYQCRTCGHRFDYFQSISSDPLTNCPVQECILEEEERKGTGEVYRRVSGGAGLVFKGEGFYLTDYVRKGSGGEGGSGGSSGGSSSKSTSKGESSGGGSSESKSAGSNSSESTSQSKGSSSDSSAKS